MLIRNIIRYNLKQVIAIAEKNVKTTLRYKFYLISGYLMPFIQLIFPFIIMGKFFSFQENFGPWNAQNYILYLFIGYTVLLTQRVVSGLSSQLSTEKVWQTLEAIMMAPIKRINILFGYLLSHLIEMSIPFVLFVIICYIIYPISILTYIIVILMLLSLLIIFSGLGIILAIFAISSENIHRVLTIILTFVFSLSCNTFPYQIFPDYIQFFINLNPIYYIIDIVRLIWIEDLFFLTIMTYPVHVIVFLTLLILFPSIGIYVFNYVFKKYGIRGY